MDLAQLLVRSCVRSFYETKHILVVDALIIHSAIRDDNLAVLMGMNTKEVHKLCGKLREDRFIAVHTRQEYKEGQQRPINRTWHYIDYRATIDAIKWRVYLISKKVQGVTVPANEKKQYFCRRCKSQWTLLEIVGTACSQGLLCDKCGFVVDDLKKDEGGHEQSTRLNAQFRFITDLLPKLDQVVIPENTFDQAYAVHRPVVRDDSNAGYETNPADNTVNRPTAVKGLSNTGPTSIAVTLTTSNGPTEADLAAEQEHKEKTAKQNEMPVHFTHSTISGEQVKFGSQSSIQPIKSGESDKKGITNDSSINGNEAAIDDFFTKLKAEAREEAQRAQELETDDDEDEDDEGFEDVIGDSGVGTPASSTNGDTTKRPPTSNPLGSGSNSAGNPLKRNGKTNGIGSASGSGTSTGLNSPAGTPARDEDGRPAKKVKIEEPGAAKDDVESEEEDMEFEDV